VCGHLRLVLVDSLYRTVQPPFHCVDPALRLVQVSLQGGLDLLPLRADLIR
jgi:hypothetical protein